MCDSYFIFELGRKILNNDHTNFFAAAHSGWGAVKVCDFYFRDSKEPRKTRIIMLSRKLSILQKISRTFHHVRPTFINAYIVSG